MKKEELRRVLINEQFKENYYDLDATGKDEALTLSFENRRWCVYYAERGQQNDKKCYDTEDEACQRILNSLQRDPSARKGYVPPVPFKPKGST